MTTIYQALASVMQDVQGVAKRDRNAAQGFNFRGIDAVVNAVGPAFRRHNVFALPNVLNVNNSVVLTGKDRKETTRVELLVEYSFVGPEGDVIRATVAAEAFDSGDKATAKAMSVAFRTALLQVLCLPTDEPDPDHDTYERGAEIARPETPLDKLTSALMAYSKDKAVRKAFVTNTLGKDVSPADLTDEEISTVIEALNAATAPFTE